MTQLSRRGFLGFLLAAPVIIKAASLMPVRSLPIITKLPEPVVFSLLEGADFDTATIRYKMIERYASGCSAMDSRGITDMMTRQEIAEDAAYREPELFVQRVKDYTKQPIMTRGFHVSEERNRRASALLFRNDVERKKADDVPAVLIVKDVESDSGNG